MSALCEEFNNDWLSFKSSPENNITVRSTGLSQDDGKQFFPLVELDALDLNYPIHDDLLHEWHKEDGEIHRVGGPAIIIRDPENPEQPLFEGWYQNGRLHREDGPAITRRKDADTEQEWWREDKRHRLDGPAELWIEASGNVRMQKWWKHDVEHREGGPSTIWTEDDTGVVSQEEWMVNGQPHRLDGPAEILRNHKTGQIYKEAWYRDGESFRQDGPALIVGDLETGKLHTVEGFFRNGKPVPPPSALSYNITPNGP